MATFRVLDTTHPRAWLDILARCPQYDFYHQPEYHTLTEQHDGAHAQLYVYTEGPYIIALPLLLRSICSVPGLEDAKGDWCDATSVYGYAGPVSSHSSVPDSVVDGFQSALRHNLRRQRVVALFSRLHPLLHQQPFLQGLGSTFVAGKTVSIDLTLPIDAQRAAYRKNHKRDVNRLRRLGVRCHRDERAQHLRTFTDLYYQTMKRVQARCEYYFSPSYFEALLSALGQGMQLFVCEYEDEIVCAGLFGICRGIVQYHLGATAHDFLSLAPMKLLFDTVRIWATDSGAWVFHLGGGVGGANDTLFHFKAGFSDRCHQFAVWRWVLRPKVYRRLCQVKRDWHAAQGAAFQDGGYFPAYRAPARWLQPQRSGIDSLLASTHTFRALFSHAKAAPLRASAPDQGLGTLPPQSQRDP